MTPTDDELRHQELLKTIRDGFHEVADAIRSTREGSDGIPAGYSSEYCEHCHQRGHADKYDMDCPQYESYESPGEHGLPWIPLGAAMPDGRTVDDLRQDPNRDGIHLPVVPPPGLPEELSGIRAPEGTIGFDLQRLFDWVIRQRILGYVTGPDDAAPASEPDPLRPDDVPDGQTRIFEIDETSGPGTPVTSADVVDETHGGQQ